MIIVVHLLEALVRADFFVGDQSQVGRSTIGASALDGRIMRR